MPLSDFYFAFLFVKRLIMSIAVYSLRIFERMVERMERIQKQIRQTNKIGRVVRPKRCQFLLLGTNLYPTPRTASIVNEASRWCSFLRMNEM